MRASGRYLAWAQHMIQSPGPSASSAWPRIAAFLGRSALESAMMELWKDQDPGIGDASWRAQLLCLRGYVEEELAADMAYTYSALSAACHYHPYDLPPTAPEIQHWLDMVDELITATSPDESTVEA